ncbi:hypothetical protein [Pseudomonas phage PPAT]|nr:hypothetical protein [Pseudomonas phage PPAT]
MVNVAIFHITQVREGSSSVSQSFTIWGVATIVTNIINLARESRSTKLIFRQILSELIDKALFSNFQIVTHAHTVSNATSRQDHTIYRSKNIGLAGAAQSRGSIFQSLTTNLLSATASGRLQVPMIIPSKPFLLQVRTTIEVAGTVYSFHSTNHQVCVFDVTSSRYGLLIQYIATLILHHFNNEVRVFVVYRVVTSAVVQDLTTIIQGSQVTSTCRLLRNNKLSRIIAPLYRLTQLCYGSVALVQVSQLFIAENSNLIIDVIIHLS